MRAKRHPKAKPLAVKTRAQERRAMRERAANARAKERGEPMPHPNPWDAVDPTKLPADPPPTDEQMLERVKAFRASCRPPQPKKHYL